VWEYARQHGFTLVTKDEDFHRLSVLYGSPPKVIWIRLGNCSTADVAQLLRSRENVVLTLLAQPDTAIVALG
jgi:predicted nuclease of predicted toxin-antitoxin system